jgi:hypothetical protein
MGNQESLSQFLAKLNTLYNNLLEFYNKFAEAMNSTAETVTAYQLNSEGEIEEMQIPSIGYYTTQVRTIKSQIDSMISANNNEISLKFEDGSVKKFEMQQLSQLVQTLESVGTMSFTPPSDFRTKTNWFFESFLNPLMFINVNVSTLLSGADIQKFSVRRVILMTSDESQNAYFDQAIKGRSDLDYNQLILSLDNEGIAYHIDDNIVDMPVAINRYRGEFTVVSIVQQDLETSTQLIYKLDKLTYYDLVNGAASVATLAVNDTLVTSDDTEYEVVAVDKTTNTVTLTKKFGMGTISIGTNQLRMRPEPYRVPELQINVGYNEREIVFISPISSKRDLAVDKWSKGFALYTNELQVTLSDGTVLDMTTYYKNFVSDFGAMFLGYAKDRQVPSTLALTPNTPTLDAANFKVVNINTHIKEDKSQLDLKAKIAAKERLENELAEVNRVISNLKARLNDSTVVNDIERMRIKKEIDQNQVRKDGMLQQLATTIQEITLDLKAQATFSTEAKYRIRGFWDIPDPKETEHGIQSVIQFRIMYRYLSKKGNATNVDQIPFTSASGQEKYGFFSNWNEQITKIRRKEYNTTLGLYVWSDENVQDPDAVNINQVDIPINKGEAVEIRVKAISEAGYPINPAESEWSTSVVIPFPDDIEATEEDALLAERIFLDAAIVKFQQDLNARGLDVHLLNSLFTADKYYAHKAEEVASGYYTPEGKIKDVFMVLKEMTEAINAIQTSLTTDYGTMKVSVTDPLGNVMEVQNGTTLQLFAGYYIDDITDRNNTFQHGNVVTKTYVMTIENTSATTLELASRIIGGISERAPYNDSVDAYGYLTGEYGTYPTWIGGDTDYTRTRVYDKVPLVVTAASDNAIGHFKQRSPAQSGQACGQFVYGRFREYGLADTLYFDDTLKSGSWGFFATDGTTGYLNGVAPYEANYQYNGKAFVTGELIPSNGYMYFPFKYDGSQTAGVGAYGDLHPEVWNGLFDSGTNEPTGNAPISEFCLHVDHPALVSGVTYDTMCRPPITGSAQSYVRVGHALHFNTTVDEKTDVFGAKYFQQCKYRNPIYYGGGTPEHKHYPIKNTFSVEDVYLIGKYTCGAYLFLAPNTYDTVVVDGNHPTYAKKDVRNKRENGINIPIVFQFRCSDKLGYVGGYRKSGDIQNVKYTKKIGIDVYERDVTKRQVALYGNIFSFDVEVSCQYTKTADIVTPITISGGALQQISYSTTKNA